MRPARTLALAVSLCTILSGPARSAPKDPFLATLSGHKGPVFSVVYSAHAGKILSGSFDNTLKYWDAHAKKEISTWEGHTDNVRAVALSPDGTRAASGGSDRKVIIWNTESGTDIAKLSGHEGIIRCIAYSSDGKYVLSGGDDKTLKLWSAAEGGGTGEPKLAATWTEHTDGVNACAFSPDAKTAISGSQDKLVILWDVATGKPIDTFKGHTAPVLAVAFSPDGTLAFSAGGDNEVRVWDVTNEKPLSRWPGHTDEVDFVVVSPDNSMVLTGGRDKTIKVWDIASRQPLRTISGGDEFIYSAAFAPDGKTAVFGVGDTLRILDIAAIRPPRHEVPKAPKLVSKVGMIEPANGILDPEIKGMLHLTVTNSGGPSADIKLSLKFPPTPGFTGLKEAIKPFKLAPGKSETFDLPVEASKSITTGSVPVKVIASEGNGFDAEPVTCEIQTRAFEAPHLSVEDVKIGGDGTIRPDQPALAVMSVKNSGGIAWDVAAKFNGTAGGGLTSLVGGGGPDTGVKALGDVRVKIGTIEPGDSKKLEFRFQVTRDFKGTRLPLSVSLTEKRPRYNMSTQPLSLELSK